MCRLGVQSNSSCHWPLSHQPPADLGFPVFGHLPQLNFGRGESGVVKLGPLCVFNHPREGRSPRLLGEQAGNAMNLLVMCALQIHSLTCLNYQRVPRMLASLARVARIVRDNSDNSDNPRRRPHEFRNALVQPKKRFRITGKSAPSQNWG